MWWRLELPTSTRVEGGGGGATRRVRGGGAATYRRRGGGSNHISTESSPDEGSSCSGATGEGGGAVRQRLELPTSWRKEGEEVQLKGEANLL
jgi:hypothetical protein